MGRNAQRRRELKHRLRAERRGGWRDEVQAAVEELEDERLPDAEQKRNGYVCEQCGGYVITVDRHEGVTPMFLGCRATNGCTGTMQSSMYRLDMLVGALIKVNGATKGFEDRMAMIAHGWPEPTWEWYRPSAKWARRQGAGMAEHVAKGGLALRRIAA